MRMTDQVSDLAYWRMNKAHNASMPYHQPITVSVNLAMVITLEWNFKSHFVGTGFGWLIFRALCYHCKLSWIHTKHFLLLSHMLISIFEVMSTYPIDQYQNAIPRAMPIHELKKSLTSRRVSRLWHRILLVVLNRSAWGFYRRVVALSLIGNAADHCSQSWKNASRLSSNPALE